MSNKFLSLGEVQTRFYVQRILRYEESLGVFQYILFWSWWWWFFIGQLKPCGNVKCLAFRYIKLFLHHFLNYLYLLFLNDFNDTIWSRYTFIQKKLSTYLLLYVPLWIFLVYNNVLKRNKINDMKMRGYLYPKRTVIPDRICITLYAFQAHLFSSFCSKKKQISHKLSRVLCSYVRGINLFMYEYYRN